MDSRTRSREGRRWLGRGLAGLVVLIGIGSSIVGSSSWRTRVHEHNETAASAAATDLAASVGGLLRREADITDGARAVEEIGTSLDKAQMQAWFDTIHASGRYAGMLGFGSVWIVPRHEAEAFLAASTLRIAEQLSAEELKALVARLETLGWDTTLDPTKRSYCLLGEGVAVDLERIASSEAFRYRDLCEGPLATVIARVRDTGRMAVSGIGAPNLLVFATPRYRHGSVPETLAERREAFTGTMGGIIDGAAVLKEVLGTRRGVWLQLARVQPDGLAEVVASSGRAPAGGARRTVAFEADGPWRLELAGPLVTTGWSADAQRLIVLAVGLLVTLLLSTLVWVLARSRDRALRLVDVKTDELRYQALHDALTGLPNRVLIVDRAEQLLARARRSDTAAASLFIDLDNFKNINDTFGHAAGDELLRAVATRLSTAVRGSDTVGRLGGDEFVVLVEGDALAGGPELVAQRVLDVLAQPFVLDAAGGLTLTVGASIGIAAGQRESVKDLLRDADVALYQAKEAGKGRFATFDAEMHHLIQERLELEMELYEAVEQGQFYLDYQPIFDLNDSTVTSLEALVRWQHPVRGVVGPNLFIPLSEENGLIVEIGQWVLREACRQTAAWHAEGYDVAVSVNVSARQLESDALLDVVTEALETAGLSASALILEITETTLMRDAEATARRLYALKQAGVRIAIDDFGTGYSSLAYLRQFAVDALKIDRTFVASIRESREADALLHTLVQLGKTLGLETYAEGIERQIELTRLKGEQCDGGQGFLFARPLASTDVISFLEEQDLQTPVA